MLYNHAMADAPARGCNIQRTGEPGAYVYSVAPDWANRPVNFVSFGDTCRFANWLHNGQPRGMQDSTTTEDGAYALNGATTDAALMRVVRKDNWKWAVVSENEWYKAAYYDPTTGDYYDYPTRSNAVPSNTLDSAGTNNANYHAGSFTIGSPYYRTEVGAFATSPSPYGTFDQGGNVWEWNESLLYGPYHCVRGASYLDDHDIHMQAGDRWNCGPSGETYDGLYGLGFRVVLVPEPTTLSLLACGGLLLARRRVVRVLPILLAGCLLLGPAGTASADVFNMPSGQKSLEFVTVGDAGNAADTRVMNDGTSGYGQVNYTYQVGKYDVTAGQYCRFLNAVAVTDTWVYTLSP